MDEAKKTELLENFRSWWREELAVAHKENTLKLTSVKEFTQNPFLWSYLAYFLEGKGDAEALARVLVYPRALGTSINTIFGTRFQQFITKYFKETFGSTTTGIDIEFIDKVDNRKKYCQLKAGPNVINHDDVNTIHNHFSAARRLARTNNLPVETTDFMFCLLYGEPWQANGFIKAVEKDYVVVMGKDFWHRFTGDPDFYNDLINAIGEVANEFNSKALVENVVLTLAKDIEKSFPDIIEQ